MATSERFDRGIEALKAIGSDPNGYQKRFGDIDEKIGPEIAGLITEFCFGDVWARPGFDYKTKRLLTLAMLLALGRERQIRVHMTGALNQGVTRQELLELCIHAGAYCGFPAMITGLEIAQEIFNAQDKK
jgi:4-carboxymuconolactone decarboxylase